MDRGEARELLQMSGVHIIGAGGVAGVGLTRCLRDRYQVTGEDTGYYAWMAMECPQGAGKPTDLTVPVPDACVARYAGRAKTFLPHPKQVEICRDKARTALVLGDLAPKCYWLRETVGAGGHGAQMLSEYLPGANHSQEFVFWHGELRASFQKHRISYSLKKITEGLENIGSSVVSVCTRCPAVTATGTEAVWKIADLTGTELHGFYAVDLKADENGRHCVTEINAGRLCTASYSFYHLTGYNLPLAGVAAYFGEHFQLPDYPVGQWLVRQIDQLPKLLSAGRNGTFSEGLSP